MKKIIYFVFILVALASCEKEGEMDLLNTVWEIEEEVNVITEGDETFTQTRAKSLSILTKSSGRFVEARSTKWEYEISSIRFVEEFTYEISGQTIYIEVERPLASYTGKIKGNTIKLKGIDGEEVYKKK